MEMNPKMNFDSLEQTRATPEEVVISVTDLFKKKIGTLEAMLHAIQTGQEGIEDALSSGYPKTDKSAEELVIDREGTRSLLHEKIDEMFIKRDVFRGQKDVLALANDYVRSLCQEFEVTMVMVRDSNRKVAYDNFDQLIYELDTEKKALEKVLVPGSNKFSVN